MRRRGRRSGLTLVEVVLATSLASLMLLVLAELTDTSLRAQHQITMQDRATAAAHDVLTEVSEFGFAARRIYTDDAEGRGFLAALDTAGLPPLPGSALPAVTQDGRLDADPAAGRQTGNVLLLAAEDAPLDLVLTSGARHRVDSVRFVAFHLSERATRVLPTRPTQIVVVRNLSERYVELASLEAIPAGTERADAVLRLRDAGLRRAWTSGQLVDQSFFDLLSDGSISATPVVSPVLAAAPEKPPRAHLVGRRMSVAPNDTRLRVPRFVHPSATAASFPSGFEVKAVGPSGGRQVLVRLVLVTSGTNTTELSFESTKVFTIRDL